jgi:hypothetical protein
LPDAAYDVAFRLPPLLKIKEGASILAVSYGGPLPGVAEWVRWIAVYRLGNAIRNDMKSVPVYRSLVERVVADGR